MPCSEERLALFGGPSATAIETTDVTGLVPFVSKTGRIHLHVMRTDLSGTTLCGRYHADRMPEPDAPIPASARTCRVCATLLADPHHIYR